jgi:hypothetical protein
LLHMMGETFAPDSGPRLKPAGHRVDRRRRVWRSGCWV